MLFYAWILCSYYTRVFSAPFSGKLRLLKFIVVSVFQVQLVVHCCSGIVRLAFGLLFESLLSFSFGCTQSWKIKQDGRKQVSRLMKGNCVAHVLENRKITLLNFCFFGCCSMLWELFFLGDVLHCQRKLRGYCISTHTFAGETWNPPLHLRMF
jgi:hypothetical protein